MAQGGELDIIDDKDLQAPLALTDRYEKLADTFDDVATSATKLNKAIGEGTQTTEEQRKTADELAKTQKKLDDANKKSAKSTRDYSKEMEYADEATGGFIGKAKQLGAQLLALAANPVGAFLLLVAGAIASVGAYFKSTGDGADKFDKIMSSITAVARYLMNQIIKLGEEISKLFEDGNVLGEAFIWVFSRIINMVTGVISTFTNLLKVINILAQYNIKDLLTGNLKPEDVKKLKDAFVDLGKSVIQAYTGIGDAAEEAMSSVAALNALTEAADALGDQIRARILSKAEAELAIEKLIYDSKNKSAKTDQQRLDALKQSVAISEQQLKIDLQIAVAKQRQYEADLLHIHGRLKSEADLNRILANGISIEEEQFLLNRATEEQLEGRYKLQADVVNLQRTYFAETKKSIAQIAALEAEIEAEAIKRETARKDRRIAEFDAYIRGSSKAEGQVLIGGKSSLEQREDIAKRSYARIAGEAKRWADYEKSLEEQKTQWLKEQAEKRRALMEALTLGAQAASMVVQGLTEQRNAELEERSKRLEVQRQKELENAGEDTRKKLAIDRKYDREQAKIKEKQAAAEKRNAMFNILISTAMGIARVAPNPVLIALTAAIGAIQFALVAGKPVPKFAKGTKSTPDTFIAGEAGHEIVSKDGKAMLVDRPTMFTGLEGAQVFNKKDTDNILGDISDVRGATNYGSRVKNQLINNTYIADKLAENNRWLKRIAEKPTTGLLVDKDGFRQYSSRVAKHNAYLDKAFYGR